MSIYCLAATYDLRVDAYDLSTGNLKSTFQIDYTQANRIIVNDKSFYVAGFSYIYVYDIHSSKPIQRLKSHENNVTDLIFNNKNNTYLTSGEDKKVKMWDSRIYQSEKCIVQVTDQEAINAVNYTEDGNKFFYGNEQGDIFLYDYRSPAKPTLSIPAGCPFPGPNKDNNNSICTIHSPVRSISATSDHKNFIITLMNGDVISCFLNEIFHFEEKYRIHAFNDTTIRSAISPDNQLFATTSINNTAKIFSLEDGSLKHNLIGSEDNEWVWDVAFTPDSKNICTGGTDEVIRVWDVDYGSMTSKIGPLKKTITALAIITQ